MCDLDGVGESAKDGEKLLPSTNVIGISSSGGVDDDLLAACDDSDDEEVAPYEDAGYNPDCCCTPCAASFSTACECGVEVAVPAGSSSDCPPGRRRG